MIQIKRIIWGRKIQKEKLELQVSIFSSHFPVPLRADSKATRSWGCPQWYRGNESNSQHSWMLVSILRRVAPRWLEQLQLLSTRLCQRKPHVFWSEQDSQTPPSGITNSSNRRSTWPVEERATQHLVPEGPWHSKRGHSPPVGGLREGSPQCQQGLSAQQPAQGNPASCPQRINKNYQITHGLSFSLHSARVEEPPYPSRSHTQHGTFVQPPHSSPSFYLLGKTLQPATPAGVLRRFLHDHELLLSTVKSPALHKATLAKHDLRFTHQKKSRSRSEAAGAAGECCSPGPHAARSVGRMH